MADGPRFFLDANVFFSAAYAPDSRAAVLVDLARVGACRLMSSGYALEEARRNLASKRAAAVGHLTDNMKLVFLVPEADAKTRADAARTGLDTGDVHILAAAVGRADALITGDRRHFGAFMGKKLMGLKVLSLAAALALF